MSCSDPNQVGKAVNAFLTEWLSLPLDYKEIVMVSVIYENPAIKYKEIVEKYLKLPKYNEKRATDDFHNFTKKLSKAIYRASGKTVKVSKSRLKGIVDDHILNISDFAGILNSDSEKKRGSYLENMLSHIVDWIENSNTPDDEKVKILKKISTTCEQCESEITMRINQNTLTDGISLQGYLADNRDVSSLSELNETSELNDQGSENSTCKN